MAKRLLVLDTMDIIKEDNMSKVVGKYINGTYSVTLLDDGTKIRMAPGDVFVPKFAENCDVKITDKCDGGCEFCYEVC